jgi:putative oxidoreductase
MTEIAAQSKPYLPGLSKLFQTLTPYGYSLIRLATGAIIIPHGWIKLFGGGAPFIAERILAPLGLPAPYFWVYFLGVLEMAGGLALALGLFTRFVAAIFVVEMAVITFGVHFPLGYTFTSRGGGYEFPLLLLVLSIGIFMRGGDRCSIDRAIGHELYSSGSTPARFG